MQTLLYYPRGRYLAKDDALLFDGDVQAWARGPFGFQPLPRIRALWSFAD